MRRMKAAELVLDFDYYPRTGVDAHNITYMVAALAAGVGLPPVVIDRKTKRVVDGFHRVRAYLRHFGPDAEIDVVEKSYKTDADLFLDAMRYNAGHGAKLDPCDRTHCTIIAERLSIPLDAVAGALHMPTDRLGELRNARTARDPAGSPLSLKRTVEHFAGRRLNKEQVAVNDKLTGLHQQTYVNQLISLIESKMLNLEDDRLMGRLKVLHGLLDDLLVAV